MPGTRAAWAQAAPARSVRLPDGASVPALGQGTWHLGQGRHPAAAEEEALRTGIALGMTLIDTAELYGDGHAEQLVGRVIAGQRDRVFLVSKVLPNHATAEGIPRACAASLGRLGTDHLDLYLLHWRGGVSDLSVVVDGFEALRDAGRIRHWGVSNFSVSDMEELMRVPRGGRCATNQVMYNLTSPGIERELLPWCEGRHMPVMAYSPLGNGSGLLRNPVLTRVAAAHGVAPSAIALAWTMRSGWAMSIPESGSADHVRENAAALSLHLTEQDLKDLGGIA
ncbi:MAG: aldo/keto reductase [Janthinobacterium lividum]